MEKKKMIEGRLVDGRKYFLFHSDTNKTGNAYTLLIDGEKENRGTFLTRFQVWKMLRELNGDDLRFCKGYNVNLSEWEQIEDDW